MNVNPYSSPPPIPVTEVGANVSVTLSSIARRVFLDWEKLRIVYIVVLGGITVTVLVLSGQFKVRMLELVVEGAVAANVLYFAGPTVEKYIRWLGYDKAWPRWLMFGCGMLLSIFLAVVVLAAELIPSQD